MRTLLLRNGLLAAMLGLLLSCGGGGGGAGGPGVVAVGTGTSTAASGGEAGGPGGPGGAGAAPGGIGGIGADDGSGTGTASAGGGGDDASGVGSGGTGVSTADATGVGSVDGAGSIFVNGLRYDTTNAVGQVEDAPNGIQLGMSARVIGPVSPDFTHGIARRVESAADIRGVVEAIDAAGGSFTILGTTVTTDEATVWADASGLAAIQAGSTLQVWGLPGAPGMLRATRVEQRDPSMPPILTGTVQNLDAALRTFTLGNLVVDYSGAASSASPDGQPLANGTLVRVRGLVGAGPRLVAVQVQWWYPVPRAETSIAQLAGLVTDFAGLGSLRVLGVPVDASGASVTGGPSGAIGNGVKIEIGGTVSDGVLRASKLKIRKVPGTGGPASFELIGNVGAFDSPSSFRVKGQPINAAGAVFTNGGPGNLRNGVRVDVRGGQVVDGVLIAQSVTFE